MAKISININNATILSLVNNLDTFYRNIVQDLLTNDQDLIDLNTVINLNGDNRLNNLNVLNDQNGCYIFLDQNNNPIYIGKTGAGESHSVKKRVSIHLRANITANGNSTLVKNIREIEGLLQNNNAIRNIPENNISDLKQLILDYAPKLIVITTGKITDPISGQRSKELEKILVALMRPKYNM